MKSSKCPEDISKWKTKSVPEFFLHHSADSNVGFWQNALSVKSYKVDVRKIQNFRSYKNKWPSNSKNGVGIPKSHVHVINGQKSTLEIWLVCSDKLEAQWYHLYLKRVYIIYRKRALYTKMVSSLLARVHTIRDKNANCQLKTVLKNCFVLSSFLRSIHSSACWPPWWRWCWVLTIISLISSRVWWLILLSLVGLLLLLSPFFPGLLKFCWNISSS